MSGLRVPEYTLAGPRNVFVAIATRLLDDRETRPALGRSGTSSTCC